MASVVDYVTVKNDHGSGSVIEWHCSSLDPSTGSGGETLTIQGSHQIAVVPDRVECEQTVEATDESPLFFTHIAASDSTANETIQVKFNTLPAGNLAGAKCIVRAYYKRQAGGGTALV